ncbi:hypothetical protein DM867_04330 [Halosegnis rubeus]|jgi:hypothetical protein|uniref:DUF8107 domain-containing protein n=1 Tax=Halosegnis rubeus TaxID=2212850 RepID=A0A5N5U9J8_9EURY|nr:hypothetical protein [Halosegnis rubeus]KAB7515303.1 hypothetical protein DMP03_08710 [Halosegnis rubeus]KAB7516357.1 hypothetical protein DM867_04330 [Halosegnis rubeus]KAB7517655.1 hypothetical protein DP108_08790 [Halosegnis rubeus]
MASDGDIRVLLVLDVLLSAVFSYVVLWGLEFADIAQLTTRNFVAATAVITVVTYLVVLRQ